MGSGTGAKWLVLIMIYFVMMPFFISLVVQVAGDTEEYENIGNSVGLCGTPRYMFRAYEPDTFTSTAIFDSTAVNAVDYTGFGERTMTGHIDCSFSAGVRNNETCSQISGCEWRTPDQSFFDLALDWFGLGSESPPTCVGEFDYDFASSTTWYGGLRVIQKHDNQERTSVCTHPQVLQNETLCDLMSCTWDNEKTLNELETEDIKPGLGILGTMWDTVKKMVTFSFDFGIEDVQTTYIVNFLIFWVPLAGAFLSLYVMVRS